jgi:hypothetical protein
MIAGYAWHGEIRRVGAGYFERFTGFLVPKLQFEG